MLSLETDTMSTRHSAAPGMSLTAMKRAEEASVSMSLSSELSDSSLLSVRTRAEASAPETPAPTLSSISEKSSGQDVGGQGGRRSRKR